MKTIDQYIKIYKQVFTKPQCELIVNKSQSNKWEKHSWTTSSYGTTQINDLNKELLVSYLEDPLMKLMIIPKIQEIVQLYTKEFNYVANNISFPRINKYEKGNEMLEHIDHISSLFQGEKPGYPSTSIILLLNDEFKGGDLIFWEDHRPKLEFGDLIIWPSNFMYRHRVSRITDGVRYSLVAWAW